MLARATVFADCRAWRYRATIVGSLLVASVAADASAQSIAVPLENPTRRVSLRPAAERPYWINQQDCLDDDVLTFRLNLTGPFASYPLEVWAGPTNDCSLPTARTGSAPACWLVGRTQPTTPQFDVSVRARDIVAHHLPTWAGGPVSAADCVLIDDMPAEAVTLQFMFVAGNNVAGTPAWFNMGYDVWPPAAPTAVTALIGDGRIELGWTRSIAADVVEYDFFCDPAPGTEATYDAGTIPTCAPFGDASPAFRAASFCGDVAGITAKSGMVEGLRDDTFYALAVAARDGVGNVGPSSFPACATPRHKPPSPKSTSDDGCGLCFTARATSPSPRGAVVSWGLPVLVWILRRARRRRGF